MATEVDSTGHRMVRRQFCRHDLGGPAGRTPLDPPLDGFDLRLPVHALRFSRVRFRRRSRNDGTGIRPGDIWVRRAVGRQVSARGTPSYRSYSESRLKRTSVTALTREINPGASDTVRYPALPLPGEQPLKIQDGSKENSNDYTATFRHRLDRKSTRLNSSHI